MGLVVVPGEYITRIEVEEFASQVRGRKSVCFGGEREEGKSNNLMSTWIHL